MKCDYCGLINDEDALYCKSCGKSLTEEQSEYKSDDGKTRTIKKKQKKVKNKKQKKNKTKKQTKVKKIKERNNDKGMTLFQKMVMILLIIVVLGLSAVIAYAGYKYYKTRDLVTVPNVTGLTYEQAKLSLEEAKLEPVEKLKSTDEEGEDNIVLKQNKKSGKKVKKNSKVKIYVGEYKVTVSNYVGLDVEKAKEKITEKGLKYNITEKESDKYSEGTVTYQDVKSGIKVKAGKIINIVVSKAKEAKEKVQEKVSSIETETFDEEETE